MRYGFALQANTGSGNALLAQLHAERAARAAARGAGQPSASEAGAGAADASSSGRAAAPARTAGGVAAAGGAPPTISLLTYNVWCVLQLFLVSFPSCCLNRLAGCVLLRNTGVALG